MIGNYWNSAWRNLMKRKKFSFINIFGLAVGMASALLIPTYVAFEFSFDKMHAKHDRIYRVQSTFYEGQVLTDYWARQLFRIWFGNGRRILPESKTIPGLHLCSSRNTGEIWRTVPA